VNDETLVTCTMIITQANSFVGAIHDRMPVLLDQEGAAAWLSGEAGLELLKPAPDDALRMWPVSRRVNKPRDGDDPTLIESIACSCGG
jgi:putative SOS response-associated peptidase YedK